MAAIVAFAIWITRVDIDGGIRYDIYFEGSVSGLRPNEIVSYKGIPIGNVQKIDVDPEKVSLVRVTVSIDVPHLIRENSYATLEVKGLTGNVEIQIKGSTKDSPALGIKEGQRYAVIKSKRSRIQELLEQAPKIFVKIVELIDQVKPTFNKKNQEGFANILQNLSEFTEALAQESGEVKNIFASVSGGGKSLRNAMDELDKLIAENRPQIKDFTSIGLYELTNLLGKLRTLAVTFDRVAQKFESSPLGFLLEEEKKVGHEIE